MRFIQHPFFERDIIGIANHILEVTQGDTGAAYRRLDEFDALLVTIAHNPESGVRLSENLEGWLVRHGGTGNRLTIVFKPDLPNKRIYLSLAAFGGRNWVKLAAARRAFSASNPA